MDFLNQLFSQFKTIYSKMSMTQKISFLLVIASIGICLIIVFLWSSQPDFVVLFSNLSTADAAKIHSKLNELKIPYEVAGTTIKVPSRQVYETRLLLANEGLPKGAHVGYEIFDKTTLGQTDYMQRLNFQRALEGELSRTISSLDAVESTRIHLVIPKPTIFTEKEEKVSASIIITASREARLSKKNVVAITHLVASSVEGLEPSDVTIIDSNGNLLSSIMESNMAVSLTSSQLEVQQNIERYLENKVSTLLMGILGPGKAIVRANAEVDFSQSEKTKELFYPESQVARSENRIEESSNTGEGNDATVEKTITNYEINKTVEHIIGATGLIKQLSMAVVIDGKYVVEGAGKDAEKVYTARTADEKESIKKLVVSSLGINEKRGDIIEVINIPFDQSYLEEQELQRSKTLQSADMKAMMQQWPWLVVVVIFIGLYLLLRKIISQASMTRVSIAGGARSRRDDEPLYDMIRDQEGYEEGGAGTDRKAAFAANSIARERVEQEVGRLAAQNPNVVAKIIKEWLSED
ncbi:MAG: flagellar M-ring protein FliF [Candidatus Omnitrophica bacterium]|nr:flagellar M-ring protein FliF [Candidatus Omnitrophota bacterium]